jgi:hypothetical protein
MDDLAQELIAAAEADARQQGMWLARLSSEHRQAVEAARDSWQKTSQKRGVSAARLATAIIDKMTKLGYSMPNPKQVARWLTTGKSD